MPLASGAAPFAMRQLWTGWLSAGLPTARGLGLALAADTPRTDTTRYQPSPAPGWRPPTGAARASQPSAAASPLVLPLPDNVKLDVQADDSLKNFDIREGSW